MSFLTEAAIGGGITIAEGVGSLLGDRYLVVDVFQLLRMLFIYV